MAGFDELPMRTYPDPGKLPYRGRSVHNIGISNFDALGHPVEYRGRRTRILEQAYVAAKNPDALVPAAEGLGSVRFMDRIFSEPNAGEVKRLGRPIYKGGLVDSRHDWDDVCIAAMDCFLRQRWQPGTRDAQALACRPRPIVEWVSWPDPRWGVLVKTRQGKNAHGLLLDIIADELLTGYVAPGADEPHWVERQEELVDMLNATHPESIVDLVAPARQMTLF